MGEKAEVWSFEQIDGPLPLWSRWRLAWRLAMIHSKALKKGYTLSIKVNLEPPKKETA